ncbi:hypothetical protein D3C87_1611360 [compost metagenome]
MLAPVLVVGPGQGKAQVRHRLIVEGIGKAIKIIVQPAAAYQVGFADRCSAHSNIRQTVFTEPLAVFIFLKIPFPVGIVQGTVKGEFFTELFCV